MQFGIQCKGDFRRADIGQLVLIVFYTTKLSDDFLQYVIPVSHADIGSICSNEVVNGENVCHLNIQGGLCPRIQIVEFVDIELNLGVRHIYH